MVFTTNEYTKLWMRMAYLSGNTSQRYNSHTCTIQYLARFGKGMNSGTGAPEVSHSHLFDIMYVRMSYYVTCMLVQNPVSRLQEGRL